MIKYLRTKTAYLAYLFTLGNGALYLIYNIEDFKDFVFPMVYLMGLLAVVVCSILIKGDWNDKELKKAKTRSLILLICFVAVGFWFADFRTKNTIKLEVIEGHVILVTGGTHYSKRGLDLRKEKGEDDAKNLMESEGNTAGRDGYWEGEAIRSNMAFMEWLYMAFVLLFVVTISYVTEIIITQYPEVVKKTKMTRRPNITT